MLGTKERIGLEDSMQSAIFKLAEGNAGALTVLIEVAKQGKRIDPDSEPLMQLLAFDSLRLYGSGVWMLYKDVCGESLSKTLAMLRAWQLGFVTAEALRHAVESRGHGIDVVELCKKVQERLANFKLG